MQVIAPAVRPAEAGPDPAASSPAAATGGPLAPEHVEAIETARRAARPIRRTAGVAACSGWSMAVFAVLSILGGIGSLPTLLVGVGLAVVAAVELRGAKGLRGFDPAAPRKLALNQVAVASVLCFYGAWGLFETLAGPGRYAEYMSAGGPVADAFAPIDQLMRTVHLLVYVAVIGFSLLAQGAMFAYYLSRRRRLVAYRRETPDWVVEMQRLTAG